jgi:hypothetical protein
MNASYDPSQFFLECDAKSVLAQSSHGAGGDSLPQVIFNISVAIIG